MLGVFDSGVGGLTVVSEIIKLHPQADIVYIGDTARIPWGNRSPEVVRHYSRQLTRFLLTKNVSTIIVACHTASSVALKTVEETAHGIPVIGMVAPAAAEAVKNTRNKSIGIIGTRVTIASQTWEKAIHALDSKIQVHATSCPLFVPLVEEGLEMHPAADLIIDHYLKELKSSSLDTLLLACTHYPFLTHKLQAYFGENIRLVNPGISVAHALRPALGGSGKITLYFTDQKPSLNRFIQLISDRANVKINSVSLNEIEHE